MEQYLPGTSIGAMPIHEIRSWLKVRKLMRAARRGEKIPPILVEARGGQMLTGTHRCAAKDILWELGDEAHESIETIELDDLDEALSNALTRMIEDEDYESINEIMDS